MEIKNIKQIEIINKDINNLLATLNSNYKKCTDIGLNDKVCFWATVEGNIVYNHNTKSAIKELIKDNDRFITDKEVKVRTENLLEKLWCNENSVGYMERPTKEYYKKMDELRKNNLLQYYVNCYVEPYLKYIEFKDSRFVLSEQGIKAIEGKNTISPTKEEQRIYNLFDNCLQSAKELSKILYKDNDYCGTLECVKWFVTDKGELNPYELYDHIRKTK